MLHHNQTYSYLNHKPRSRITDWQKDMRLANDQYFKSLKLDTHKSDYSYTYVAQAKKKSGSILLR